MHLNQTSHYQGVDLSLSIYIKKTLQYSPGDSVHIFGDCDLTYTVYQGWCAAQRDWSFM